MTTAQQVVEAAYSRSTANDPGKLATDNELIGYANRVYHTLYALAASAAPERYMAKTVVTLIGAPGTGAIPFDLIDIRRVETALGGKITVIPLEEKDRGWHLAPAVFRQGLSLVSRGGVGDPLPGDTLTAWILDAPADLVALGSVIDTRFPTRHIELIVLELAMYLATKDTGRDAGEFASLTAAHTMQMAAFAQLTGLPMTALQSPHSGMLIQSDGKAA